MNVNIHASGKVTEMLSYAELRVGHHKETLPKTKVMCLRGVQRRTYVVNATDQLHKTENTMPSHLCALNNS